MTALAKTDLSVETLAADALAQSRLALPALRQITQDLLFGDAKAQAQAIIGSIERRDILKSCVSWDLSDLIRHLDAEIDDATVSVELWSDHDCDVTGNSWVETVWTQDAVNMAAVRTELTTLCERIDAVLDVETIGKVLPFSKRKP
ncbi:hypothetical protein [uncultured Sulfitobacter sp.]|jgi:hypothetical protein|uniref:hypothetical protein n=1 Tax=Sulfitobacter sp. SH22 TaxID=3421172 RepID=UPI0025D17832|nr:hypothetical protein [uncultured Sulfitobacter sp.]